VIAEQSLAFVNELSLDAAKTSALGAITSVNPSAAPFDDFQRI
jgi:hypothetical protein